MGIGRRVYFIGGSTGGGPTSSVEIYDILTDTWKTGTPMPSARVAPTIAMGRDHRLYVIGGIKRTTPVPGGGTTPPPGSGSGGAPSSPPEEAKAVDIYDPRWDAWIAGPEIATGRHSLASTTMRDGRILAIGGWSGGGRLAPILQHADVEALVTLPEGGGREPRDSRD